MTREQSAHPFDESAALSELERLRESIAAARLARKRASDEFDAFVKGFRTPASPPASAESIAASGVPDASLPAAEASSRSPSPRTVSSNAEAFAEVSAPVAEKSQRRGLNIRPLGVAAIIAVVMVGLLLPRWRKQSSPPTGVNTAASTQLATGRAETPSSTGRRSVTTPAAAHAVLLEMTTVRPVWMRVVVDGRKSVEGMVQGGESLRFSGDQSIVVRVGNGGDVLVKSGTREDRFGDAGQPVTRTFLKP